MRPRSLLFALLSALILVVGCKPSESTPATAPAPALPVRVAPVEFSPRALPVRVTGVLQRKAESDLSFKISGLVATVDVRVGDAVVAGQVLARLHTEEIDAQVAQARAGRDKAQRDFARAEALAAEKVATLENVQDARSAFEVASAQVAIAEFNQRHAVIVAPSAGRVLRRMIEPNEWVAPGRAVIGFADDGEGWLVKAGVAETEAGRLRVGNEASLSSEPGATPFGRVTQMSEALDPASRTLPVEVRLLTAPNGLRSGSVVTLWIQPDAVPARPRVPASALIEGSGREATLFLVVGSGDESTVAQRRVSIEAWSGSHAYLTTSLPDDARLVTDGAEYLRDGARVRIQP